QPHYSNFSYLKEGFANSDHFYKNVHSISIHLHQLLNIQCIKNDLSERKDPMGREGFEPSKA
ncbi:MAG: hypothetical protein U9N32_07030, partial [Spirochaetota bacterium]|nr:hypothetical protein [Spirochaetota bacterium]